MKEKVSNTKTEPLIFAVMSDIHIGNRYNSEGVAKSDEMFANALAWVKNEYGKVLNAIVINGDMTDGGHEPQYDRFVEILDNAKLGSEVETIISLGNHENGFGGETHARFIEKTGKQIDYVTVVNGYTFIVIGVHKGDRYIHNQATWLEGELEKAVKADKDRPVFFVSHYPAANTTVQSGGNNGKETFLRVLNKYPNVINLTAHSHTVLSDPRMIHQDKFTSVSCGSFTYLYYDKIDFNPANIPLPTSAHFQIISVEGNKVTIKNVIGSDIDPKKTRVLDRAYEVDTSLGIKGFKYKGDWYSTVAPEFAQNDLAVQKIGDGEYRVSFSEAIHEYCVYYYKILIFDPQTGVELGKQIVERNIASGQYRNELKDKICFTFRPAEKPANTVKSATLINGKNYKAEVHAYSVTVKCSSPLSGEFMA